MSAVDVSRRRLPTAEAVHELTRRSVRNIIRVPAGNLPSLVIPLFFLAVNVGALGLVAHRFVPPGESYISFFLPTAIILSITNSATSAGIGVVNDITSGYFDKLLLAPIPRISIVFGRLAADGGRAVIQTALLLVVGLIFGASMKGGAVGFVLILVLMGLWAIVYAGVGLAIALRTGSQEVTQVSFLLGFPLIFLSPATVPIKVMAPWMQTLAHLNPVTYLMQAIRAIILYGIDWVALGEGLLGIGLVAAVTVPLSLLALKRRVALGAAR